MNNPKEMVLPSGASLKIMPAPFDIAKRLWQAVLAEVKYIDYRVETDYPKLIKDLFCTGFSSKEIDKVMMEALLRCTYNDLKIDGSTFEAVERREDYTKVLIEVAKENLYPFFKSLFAEFKTALSTIETIRK